MARDPFGKLVSFGTITEPGYITFTNSSGPLSKMTLEWNTSFTSMPPAEFPYDDYGIGAAPLKEPEATWVYLLRAADGSTTPYADVEGQWAAIRNAFEATNSDGSSGQVGTLVVKDAGGTNRSCQARIIKAEVDLEAAVNTRYYHLPLTWKILSKFT